MCRIERFAGEQQVAKVAAIVGSGQGGDIAVVRDFDALPLRRQARST